MFRVTASLLVTIGMSLALAQPAAAHEKRDVGKYIIEMGWNNEPALAGLLNAVFLEVREKTTDKGVEGLQDTLSVTVTIGGATSGISPKFHTLGRDEPGVYLADLIPTRAGDYVFRLVGKIGDQTVDERYESGPNRFSSIEPATEIQYPDQVDAVAELRTIGDRLNVLQVTTFGALALGVVALGLSALGLRRSSRS